MLIRTAVIALFPIVLSCANVDAFPASEAMPADVSERSMALRCAIALKAADNIFK